MFLILIDFVLLTFIWEVKFKEIGATKKMTKTEQVLIFKNLFSFIISSQIINKLNWFMLFSSIF